MEASQNRSHKSGGRFVETLSLSRPVLNFFVTALRARVNECHAVLRYFQLLEPWAEAAIGPLSITELPVPSPH
jgi:hypothetical protein